jgi:hypothetical protein
MVVVGNFRNRAELRKRPRRHFHYSARIVIDEKGTLRACQISDISETGARLVLENVSDLPDQFMLLLTPNGEARRRCRVVWRDGAAIGVAFPDADL